MKEIRCKKCKSLLMVLNEGGEVKQTHIKCRKCGKINQIIEVKYNPNYETRDVINDGNGYVTYGSTITMIK